MYSTRSTVAATETSSDSLAHSTTGVRSIGALLVSDEHTQALPTGFQIFPSHHAVTAAKIVTSTDTRGFIPVLEYTLRDQTIMIDAETRMCHWTGIWKALGKNKADVVRLIESEPDIAGRIRKIRGGHLKVQGTWLTETFDFGRMPYEIARELCRRVAWDIRHDLVPLFGPTFPDSCIAPGQPGFGKPVLTSPGDLTRRSSRDPKAREAAQKAARAAQNNKWVDTARQAKGFVPVGDRQPFSEPASKEVPGATDGAREMTEISKVALQSSHSKTTPMMIEKPKPEGKDENEAVTVRLKVEEPTKGELRSETRVRTKSGNWYAGGGPARGTMLSHATASSSTRYAPYRFPAAPPPYAYSPSLHAYLPPPVGYDPTTSAYPPAMPLDSSFDPSYLHPSHAHVLAHRHEQRPAQALARALSVPDLHFHAPASTFTFAPHFSGVTSIRRTVSDPQAQRWEAQPASADAEGGRLALGLGTALVAESRLGTTTEATEMTGQERAAWAQSTAARESQKTRGFAGRSAESLRLPPIARVEERSVRPASFFPSGNNPTLPPISHLRGYEADSPGNNRPYPPHPTLITQEDLLSHAAHTTRSHPNYSSDPHRHLTAPSSPITLLLTSPLSAASSQGSLLFQPQDQGQPPSPLTPINQQCHQNEQQLGHLVILERCADHPSAELEKAAC